MPFSRQVLSCNILINIAAIFLNNKSNMGNECKNMGYFKLYLILLSAIIFGIGNKIIYTYCAFYSVLRGCIKVQNYEGFNLKKTIFYNL